MKYYIIAGEASGDLHASNLIKELKLLDGNAQFRCWGGDLMQVQGAILAKHYRDLAFMGFWEVLRNIFTIIKNIRFCKKDIKSFDPDVLILVDYPGFNLRIAKFAHLLNYKVFYYISPQLWAWKQSRVKLIRKVVDRMFVILPFEKDFYKGFDFEVDFVGHPLLDAINLDSAESVNKALSKQIAILPGSRKQEISKMLPVMLSIKPHYPDHRFVIAGTSSVPKKFYDEYMKDPAGNMQGGVDIVFDKTYDVLRSSEAALVTSGTATLETALLNVPEVVCYKSSAFSFFIAKYLIKTNYISLVNIMMEKEVVKELIQFEFNADMLRKELDRLVNDNVYREKMLNNFIALKEKLGGSGASSNAASLMIKYLR
ncbi:MAG TPA: lipid-A-disaccharide synthase [Flavobacteriales bacterium]|nr:lipid-A-disaccharide synthase [Flavobacteriales bacterium]HIN39993.1 lipid-A-disaccharide synthase [Flavobacteriales bacterium]